jgi:hypothetical protein
MRVQSFSYFSRLLIGPVVGGILVIGAALLDKYVVQVMIERSHQEACSSQRSKYKSTIRHYTPEVLIYRLTSPDQCVEGSLVQKRIRVCRENVLGVLNGCRRRFDGEVM